jgi:hypothetical protein
MMGRVVIRQQCIALLAPGGSATLMLRTKIGIRVCVNRRTKAARLNRQSFTNPCLVELHRKQAVVAIVAAILATRKLATVPQNSPAYVAAIADAVSGATKIVDGSRNPPNRSRLNGGRRWSPGATPSRTSPAAVLLARYFVVL